jgi:quercetin dioxygenase-like cupin family protein
MVRADGRDASGEQKGARSCAPRSVGINVADQQSATVTVVSLTDVAETPLPNGSWNKLALNRETVPGTASSLGYSVFRPGTVLQMVSHEVEEFAFVLSGRGELRLDDGAVPFAGGQALHIPPNVWHAVANTGEEDVVMVFGFPYPVFPPTERRG